MKKIPKKRICIVAWILLFSMMLNLVDVQASAKGKVVKLVDAMDKYVQYTICVKFYSNQYGTKPRTKYTVKLSKRNMASAAALSLKVSKKQRVKRGKDDSYVIYQLSPSKIKKRSKNLFGKAVKPSDLSVNDDQPCYHYVFQRFGHAYVYYDNMETDIDFVRRSFTIKKKSSLFYIVSEKVFWGHWSKNNGDPNYEVIYKVRKKQNSSYGFVIESMKIRKL